MAKPLVDVVCITEPSCEYPVAVKMLMDDGTVQTYDFHCDTHPNFAEAMDALDRMFDCIKVTGYQYKPEKKRRNRIQRGKR